MPEADSTIKPTPNTAAAQRPPSFRGVHEAHDIEENATPRAKAVTQERLDERQEQIMADRSVDGRAPSHQSRRSEWRWIGFTLIALAIAALVWALVSGVNPGVIFGYAILGAFLLAFGGWPVWITSMKRSQEETAATQQAARQLNARK